jgi:signal peptidase I
MSALTASAPVRHSHERRTGGGRRGWMLWAVLIIALASWWTFAAPPSLGGRTSFVIVLGHSMEPMLHSGDLAFARAQSAYHLGDLVVYRVADSQGGGNVIHRLVAGSTAIGWTTKGDNNPHPDSWSVPNSSILGEYQTEVPQVGTLVAYVGAHPLPFGAVCALLSLVAYLPWHRRRIAPALATALASARKEPVGEGRGPEEYGLFAISAVGAVGALAVLVMLGMAHGLVTVQGAVAATALVWSGGITAYLSYRLFDGRGVVDPRHSLYALSGRLYEVDAFPPLDEPILEVTSPVEMRRIAEKWRLPVLHRVDPVGHRDEFLLITDHHGDFHWQAHPHAGEPGAHQRAGG